MSGDAAFDADISDLHKRIDELHELSSKHSESLGRLADVLENKLDKLIDVVAGRGMIPLDVFKWLVIFVCVFVFSIEFGVKGVAEVIHSVKP